MCLPTTTDAKGHYAVPPDLVEPVRLDRQQLDRLVWAQQRPVEAPTGSDGCLVIASVLSAGDLIVGGIAATERAWSA
jgi:hypothetical protein